MNLFLADVKMETKIMEYILVSKRKRLFRDRVEKFLRDFDSDKTTSFADLIERFQGNDREQNIWKHLHATFNVFSRVARLMNHEDGIYDMLLRHSGHELELIERLEAKEHGGVRKSARDSAEWVRLPSLKHPGNYFYRNNRSKVMMWEPPAGVEFRQVLVSGSRIDSFEQVLVRGDVVILVSNPTGNSKAVIPTTNALLSSSSMAFKA